MELPIRSHDIICSKIQIYVFVSYIPPNSEFAVYNAHVNNIKNVISIFDENSFAVILGDFNLCNIKWLYSHDDKCLFPIHVLKDFECVVTDTFSALNLYQVNDVVNEIGRILDLVYIHKELDVAILEDENPLLNNSVHHKALKILCNLSIFQYVCI